jgi:hypothetical protein
MRLWETLSTMAWADIARSDWFVAGDARAELRAHGVQVSLADVLIAGAASERATPWTRDRAFDEIAGVLDGLQGQDARELTLAADRQARRRRSRTGRPRRAPLRLAAPKLSGSPA